MTSRRLLMVAPIVAIGISLLPQDPQQPRTFSEYWNRGLAEIARYELTQSRYGEPREGHAIMVFVAEDLKRDTQVKDEGRERSGAGAARVLKLNRIQRFTTGIYDYSLMQSVFTPVDRARDPHTLKTTASIQDWCGHVWEQLNLDGDEYRLTLHSYFEGEADERRRLPAELLEDELFNLIRIDPSSLPVGRVRLIPGAFHARLRHVPLRVESARAELEDGAEGERVYVIRYDSGRRLEISFEKKLPHGILGFRETVGEEVTEAKRTRVRWSAYWKANRRSDASLRPSLGLESDDIGRR